MIRKFGRRELRYNSKYIEERLTPEQLRLAGAHMVSLPDGVVEEYAMAGLEARARRTGRFQPGNPIAVRDVRIFLRLRPKHLQDIRRTYLDYRTPLKDVAKVEGLSRERVRQIFAQTFWIVIDVLWREGRLCVGDYNWDPFEALVIQEAREHLDSTVNLCEQEIESKRWRHRIRVLKYRKWKPKYKEE